MENKAFLEQLKKYEDKWVAILEPDQRVVASGNNASEAKQEAKRKGYDSVILFRVFPFRAGYIPFS